MTNTTETNSAPPGAEVIARESDPAPLRPRRLFSAARLGVLLVAAIAIGGVWATVRQGSASTAPPPPAPPLVTVSTPLRHDVGQWAGFLGQFAAVDRVELRPQVGGTLAQIGFKDGDIVHQGELLFLIDPRPYSIKAAEQQAQIQSVEARLAFSGTELWRAQQLKKTEFGTTENLDQRTSDQRATEASLAQAQSELADSELDIEYAHVTAPFTGRIGAHQVSVGSLVTGSRGGTSGTTLLATLVSLNPIYLNFHLSEADYLAFTEARASTPGPLSSRVDFSLGDDGRFTRHGTLDFIDNTIDSSSGTILARATVDNPGLLLVPGEFARVRLAISPPTPALLIPDAAVIPDQSQDLVMTVAPDGTVVPKIVETGDLSGGLRVIRAGLAPTDRVIIDGLMHAMPGTKVTAQAGTIPFDPTVDTQD
jgi:membrane fusion protein, multidrug efflux system